MPKRPRTFSDSLIDQGLVNDERLMWWSQAETVSKLSICFIIIVSLSCFRIAPWFLRSHLPFREVKWSEKVNFWEVLADARSCHVQWILEFYMFVSNHCYEGKWCSFIDVDGIVFFFLPPQTVNMAWELHIHIMPQSTFINRIMSTQLFFFHSCDPSNLRWSLSAKLPRVGNSSIDSILDLPRQWLDFDGYGMLGNAMGNMTFFSLTKAWLARWDSVRTGTVGTDEVKI